MKMRLLFLILFGTAALLAPPSFAASSIESEPLPPPPGQQAVTPPRPITTNTAGDNPIPLTTRSGAPATASSAPASATKSSADNGMSGADGAGSSAYDLGAPKMPAPDTSPERDTGAPVATTTTTETTKPYVYKPTVRTNPVITMGSAPPEDKSLESVKFCTLKVTFNSIGTGTDAKTDEKIKSYLAANADKLTYTTANFGREGEHSYCIDINQHNFRSKIYTDLKRMLPPQGINAPETKLSGEGFAPVTTSR